MNHLPYRASGRVSDSRKLSSGCMTLSGHYRHELKYMISHADYLALRSRLRAVMPQDPHVNSDGKYQIRSIYYDNYRDKALREKLDGIQKREKFRIRWYNDDLSFLTLEKKQKHNDLCLKIDAPIAAGELQRILCSPGPWMMRHKESLIQELYCKIQSQQLQPRVVVSYEREPYIYRPGNVRVTFDSQIRTSLFHPLHLPDSARSDELFRASQTPPQSRGCSQVPLSGAKESAPGSPLVQIRATDAPGDIILEVKYDAFLPDIIADLLQTEELRQQAFSKYGACRRFG